MQEIDLVPLAKSGRLRRVIVDSREACLAEAGEIQRLVREQPVSEREQDSWLPELGQLVTQDGYMSDRVDEDVLLLLV
jgi:ornithine cyclodeaminase/alanine dehydrogenase-like protein (mu-crystallin family)